MANLIERLTGIEGTKEFSLTSKSNGSANILRHALLGFGCQIMLPATTHQFLNGGRNGDMSEHDTKMKVALLIDTASIIACAIFAYRNRGGIKDFIHSKLRMNVGTHLVMAALSKPEVDNKQKFC